MPRKRSELVQMITENMATIRRGMIMQVRTLETQYNLTHGQFELLILIYHHRRPVTATWLANRLQLSPGAISQIVEGLEQRGYIVRTPSPTDRRVQDLSLTEMCKDQLHHVGARRRKLMETVMSSLSDEELTLWYNVQQKLLNHMQQEQGETK